LLDQGTDVPQNEYAYFQTDFLKKPESEQDKWISSDVLEACNNELSHHSYEKTTLFSNLFLSSR
jgi:hypothetical protein